MNESCMWCEDGFRYAQGGVDKRRDAYDIYSLPIDEFNFCPNCGRRIKEEPHMTNADRIRSMTDEELMREICGCRHCIHFGECGVGGGWLCDEGILAWLKQEVPHEE